MTAQYHRYAPMNAQCGDVLDDSWQTESAKVDTRCLNKDGSQCGFPTKHTLMIDGKEIAVCQRHENRLKGDIND